MKRRAAILLSAVVAATLLFAIWHLFELRFASGDVYPPYSTLRADPLGARAFYASLGLLPGVRTQALFEPVRRLESGRDTTLYVLGLETTGLDRLAESDVRELEQFMADGGRLVLTLLPEAVKPYGQRRNERKADERKKEAAEKKKADAKKKRDVKKNGDPNPTEASPEDDESVSKKSSSRKRRTLDQDEEELARLRFVSLRTRWGFGVDFGTLPRDAEKNPEPQPVFRAPGHDELPAQLLWHSAVGFRLTNSAWRAIYQAATNAAVAERVFGNGSLVLASDSYLVSNEALRRDRHPALLTWLAGPARRQVFDETHFGVERSDGIATLARRYRLHGLFASLLLLAVLFIWKNATSFVPPHDELNPDDLVTGKGASEGFINLIRRGVPPGDLLRVCFAEWQKSFGHGRPDLAARVAQVRSVVDADAARPARERNPVAAYRAACEILAKRH